MEAMAEYLMGNNGPVEEPKDGMGYLPSMRQAGGSRLDGLTLLWGGFGYDNTKKIVRYGREKKGYVLQELWERGKRGMGPLPKLR